MLDSLTSRPECCYSALSSAEAACASPQLRLALPQPEAPLGGKHTPPALPNTTYTYMNMHTRIDWQVLPFFSTSTLQREQQVLAVLAHSDCLCLEVWLMQKLTSNLVMLWVWYFPLNAAVLVNCKKRKRKAINSLRLTNHMRKISQERHFKKEKHRCFVFF